MGMFKVILIAECLDVPNLKRRLMDVNLNVNIIKIIELKGEQEK